MSSKFKISISIALLASCITGTAYAATAPENPALTEAQKAAIAATQSKRIVLEASAEKDMINSPTGTKIKLSAAKKEVAKKTTTSIFLKIFGAIGKIGAFDKQVSAAINKRKTEGLNIALSSTALQSARKTLDESKIEIDAINAAMIKVLNGNNAFSKEAFMNQLSKATAAVGKAKESYMQVIISLE